MAWIENTNIISSIYASAVSIVLTFGVVTITERRKGRHTASEKEVEARASYVDLLQKRVGELELRIDQAANREHENEEIRWRRERESEERCRRELEALEQRWRHLTNSLVTWALILKIKLEEKGEQVPKFSGMARFEEEGGLAPEEWKIGGL